MCQSCAPTLTANTSEEFAQRMLGILNSAGIALMCSVGHRTGLFDALKRIGTTTCADLAAAAGLRERYVREWLGAMVTGGIVLHDGDTGTYWLPEEHAAFLTSDAGADNIAGTLQWVSVIGSVESQVVEAFKNGGGVPYEAYERFNEVMADESSETVVAALEEHILPLEPGLIERLEQGVDVLDVGCGCGKAMIQLAARFPNSRFVGYDFQQPAIEAARNEVAAKGLTNVRFEVQDAAKFEDTDAFDVIFTFDAVHDQADPDAMLANIHRALKPGGTYLCQDIQGTSTHAGDINLPLAPFIYTISCLHCMTVSLSQGGRGLGAAWGRQVAEQMIGEAGFDKLRVDTLDHDILNYYYIASKAA